MRRKLILLYILCVNFSISVFREKPFYNINEAPLLFKKFKNVYGKRYLTKLEEEMRFHYFMDTLKDINFLNSVNRDAIFDINENADLSKKEFALTHTGFKEHAGRLATEEPPCNMFFDTNVTSNLAPPRFDWRELGKVAPVRKQGKCGSCWAFSLTDNISSQFAILTNMMVQFSVQQLVDCMTSSEGCNGGDNVESARALISCGGVESETDYPYKARNQNCSFDATKISARVIGCNHYDLKNEEKLKEVLYRTGPLSIVIDATLLHPYSGGVIDYCPQHEGNHAVVLVGYGTEKDTDFWVIKNSWGEKWGEKGFFRLKRGINACGLLNDDMVSAILEV